MSASPPRHVLDQYALDWHTGRIESLQGAGGYSGAQFWRITLPGQQLCLRRWPSQHPAPKKLAEIHDLLQRAGSQGLRYLPVPRPARHGSTVVEASGHLWELARWLPGKADYCDNPSPQRLAAALRALAEFHQAVARTGESSHCVGISPGILHRQRRLHQLVAGRADRIATAVAASQPSRREQVAGRLLAAFWKTVPRLAPILDKAANVRVALQPCIRDVWHDHVLLTGAEVTGLVDFGAVSTDTVAGDVARLLGSMVGDSQGDWRAGLGAYQAVRPLSGPERYLVTAFDRANVALSGLQWLEWIYVEGKRFEDPGRIVTRLEQIMGRVCAMLG